MFTRVIYKGSVREKEISGNIYINSDLKPGAHIDPDWDIVVSIFISGSTLKCRNELVFDFTALQISYLYYFSPKHSNFKTLKF